MSRQSKLGLDAAGRSGAAAAQRSDLSAILSALVDSDDCPVFSVDESYRYTSFNAAHVATMKLLYDIDIEFGLSFLDCLTVSEDRRRAQANLEKALRGERLVMTELVGDEALARHCLEITHHPIRDDGKVIGVAVRARDVTDRQRAAEADARLAAIVESSDDAILSKTLDGTVVTWNRGAERLYGYAAGEIVGESVAKLMPNGSNEELATLLARVRDSGGVEYYETVRVRKNGSPVPVSLSLSPIKDAAGRVIGASTIGRDISERRQAEEALRSSAAMLTTAESVAQLGGWRWDLSTEKIALSQGMFGLFAVDTAGFDGDWMRLLPERVHPDDLAAVLKAIASVRESGAPVPLEFRLRLPDGSERIVHGEGRAERDEAGQMVAVVGYCQDVTERRNAEAALRESERRFRGLVENISDVISSYDVGLRYRYLSPSFSRFMGIDGQSFIGKTHREAGLSEELADCLDAGLTQALSSGRPVDFEFMMPGEAGEAVAEVRMFPELDDEGRPAGVVTVTHDVTASRRAEGEIRLARQRLALHVEQTPLAVIEFDLGGHVREWNPAAEKVFGYSRGEAVGRHWSFIVPAAWHGRIDDTWAAIVGQRAGGRSTNDNVTKDGGTINCEWFNTALVDPDGQTVGVASLIQDVTRRRQAEQQLRDSVLRLVAITDGVITALSRSVEMRDPYTAGHERRVGELAAAIARSLGLAAESVQHVQIAGRLHDVGKIMIPAEILSKPGRLSEMEFTLIKDHPQAAYGILEPIEFDFPLAEIVVQHHERLDGSGYPAGLAGDAILPEARILAVADVVEAMSSHRPYRPALGTEVALAEVREHAGEKYDADVVVACARLFEEQGFQFTL